MATGLPCLGRPEVLKIHPLPRLKQVLLFRADADLRLLSTRPVEAGALQGKVVWLVGASQVQPRPSKSIAIDLQIWCFQTQFFLLLAAACPS